MVEQALKTFPLEDKQVLIACSGGLDSTVLLHAVLRCGIKPAIVHINYQLRETESDADETFVRKLAETNNVPLRVLRCPTHLTKGSGINLQKAAREFRHRIFREWIHQSPKNVVLLAHHADDQIETFFLQLARGAGSFGLGGMHPDADGLLRPFLELRKQDLLHYALQHELSWREDSSNTQEYYLRNRLRNTILPELYRTQPDLVTSVTLLQHHLREEQQRLIQELQPVFHRIEQEKQCRFSEWNQFSNEEKILIFKHLYIDLYLIPRIPELEKSELSKQLDEGKIIRTKDGFSWWSEFPGKTNWEFKSNSIGFLPNQFSNTSLILDTDLLPEAAHIGFPTPELFLIKAGTNYRSNIHKLLKDAGIPEQWRNSYPVLIVQNEVIWVPGIAVGGKYLATKSSTKLMEISLKTK